MMLPTAAVVAGAEPLMAPKKVAATTVAMLSPPDMWPTSADAMRMSRLVRPPPA
jgi:hypothetical protein